MPLETDCPVGPEVLTGLGEFLEGVVESVRMADGSIGYQLQRLGETGELIRRTVQRRVGPKSKRHRGNHDFPAVVDGSLGALRDDSDDAEIEIQARREKAAALEEIYASRISVLIGAAGTGKTTLLKMLCELRDVEAGGVLLLAPTGKARVQLETRTGMTGGLTIAQFLDALWQPIRYRNRSLRHDGQPGSLPRLPDRDRRRMLNADRRAARRIAGWSERCRPASS